MAAPLAQADPGVAGSRRAARPALGAARPREAPRPGHRPLRAEDRGAGGPRAPPRADRRDVDARPRRAAGRVRLAPGEGRARVPPLARGRRHAGGGRPDRGDRFGTAPGSAAAGRPSRADPAQRRQRATGPRPGARALLRARRAAGPREGRDLPRLGREPRRPRGGARAPLRVAARRRRARRGARGAHPGGPGQPSDGPGPVRDLAQIAQLLALVDESDLYSTVRQLINPHCAPTSVHESSPGCRNGCGAREPRTRTR